MVGNPRGHLGIGSCYGLVAIDRPIDRFLTWMLFFFCSREPTALGRVDGGQVPEVRISILGDLPQFFCVESLFCSLLSGRVLLVRIRRTLAETLGDPRRDLRQGRSGCLPVFHFV